MVAPSSVASDDGAGQGIALWSGGSVVRMTQGGLVDASARSACLFLVVDDIAGDDAYFRGQQVLPNEPWCAWLSSIFRSCMI